MFYFYLLYLTLILFEIDSFKIDKTVNDYFNSETFVSFQNQWQRVRKSYESAVRLALRDNYGYKGMNVYIRKSADSHRIANGFYVYDNVVGVMCHDMFLGELPHFTAPEVTMAVAANVLRIETGLSKIFVYTQYILFRNHTDIMKGGEDPTNRSPFTFQDVQDSGPLAIIAEDCTLSGYAVSRLSGQSVDLGHNTFTLSECKFSIEISSLGMGLAPVTASYFNQYQSKELEKLISKPIREELIPKLQASLLIYVNTSSTFGDKLGEYRQHQVKLFKETSKYFLNIIKALNKNTIRISQGAIPMKPFSVTWNVCEEKPCESRVSLKDINLYGLDTVYSSHNGGPYRLQSMKIGEEIHFNYIQVRGTIGFKNDSISSENDFFAELHDVNINIEIDMEKDINVCDFVDWRSLQLSIIGFKGSVRERINANSLISGHLINEVPKVLIDHILQMFENKKPMKLSHTSVEQFVDTNTKELSRSLEHRDDQDHQSNNGFKKKKFDKRGEISKGGNKASWKVKEHEVKKKTFDKRVEVGKVKSLLGKKSGAKKRPMTSSQDTETNNGSKISKSSQESNIGFRGNDRSCSLTASSISQEDRTH